MTDWGMMGRLRRTLQGLQGCGTLLIMYMMLTGRSATEEKTQGVRGGSKMEGYMAKKKNQYYYRYLHCDASRAVIPHTRWQNDAQALLGCIHWGIHYQTRTHVVKYSVYDCSDFYQDKDDNTKGQFSLWSSRHVGQIHCTLPSNVVLHTVLRTLAQFDKTPVGKRNKVIKFASQLAVQIKTSLFLSLKPFSIVHRWAWGRAGKVFFSLDGAGSPFIYSHVSSLTHFPS